MISDSFKQVIRSPLGRRFFLFIVIFSSVITLFITSIQIYNDYKMELSDIDREIDQIKKTNLQSLSQSVWVMDQVQGKKQLEGLVRFSYIDYAEVRSDGGVIWNTDYIKVDNPVTYSLPLTYSHRDKEVTIGMLELKGSLNKVYKKLFTKVLFILGSNALKTSLVAVFILFIFYYILGKQIIDLADFAHRFGKSEKLPEFDIERYRKYLSKDNELTVLIQSMHDMVNTIRDREDSLKVLSTAVEQSPNAIILTDPEGRIEYTNTHFTAVSGYTLEDVRGKTPGLLGSGNTSKGVYKELWDTIKSGNIWSGELQNKTKKGVMYWESARIAPIQDGQGNTVHYLAIKEDITLRKSYEEKLLHQANFDSLTNLPNRILAFDRISQALISSQRIDEHVAIMFIDLDRFKNVNDTLGHVAGDELLKQTAERLRTCVRMEDTVARLGGDEFLIILSHIKSEKNVDTVAQKILQRLSDSFNISERDIYVSASIGITFYPDDGDTPEILLRNADSAMYKAKAEGRNNYCYFTKAMDEQAKDRLEIESNLRNALANRELELYFQPIKSAQHNTIDTAEALLRWHSKKLGTVPPDIFIPLAEEIGLIVPIGNWVLKTACNAAASTLAVNDKPLRIAINVSARQFTMSNLVATVDDALLESGLPAELLEIEVTEGILLEDSPYILDTFQALHNRGIRISIDDFGTGYSALSYLQKFPVNTLKIDRSFVRDIEHNTKNAELSSAIINMAHVLNIEVIGEGVETEGQFNILKDKEIDYVQGYLFSRPLPIDQFKALLAEPREKEEEEENTSPFPPLP